MKANTVIGVVFFLAACLLFFLSRKGILENGWLDEADKIASIIALLVAIMAFMNPLNLWRKRHQARQPPLDCKALPAKKRGLEFVRIAACQGDACWKSYESSTYDFTSDRYPARDYLERSSAFFNLRGRFDNDPNPTMDIIICNKSASPQILLSYGIEVTAARFRIISGGLPEKIILEKTEHYKIEFPYPKLLTGENACDNTTKTIAVATERYRGTGAFSIGDFDSPDAVCFWEWEWAGTPVVSTNVIGDPPRLKTDETYRFSLEIERSERMPTDTLLRILIKTDNGEFKSDSIYFLKP